MERNNEELVIENYKQIEVIANAVFNELKHEVYIPYTKELMNRYIPIEEIYKYNKIGLRYIHESDLINYIDRCCLQDGIPLPYSMPFEPNYIHVDNKTMYYIVKDGKTNNVVKKDGNIIAPVIYVDEKDLGLMLLDVLNRTSEIKIDTASKNSQILFVSDCNNKSDTYSMYELEEEIHPGLDEGALYRAKINKKLYDNYKKELTIWNKLKNEYKLIYSKATSLHHSAIEFASKIPRHITGISEYIVLCNLDTTKALKAYNGSVLANIPDIEEAADIYKLLVDICDGIRKEIESHNINHGDISDESIT